MWHEFESIFGRAFKYSFARKKLLLVFPLLLLCGVLVVLSHALAIESNHWVGVSLAFFPTYLCTGVLMAGGIPLIRIYHDELKGRTFRYRHVVRDAWRLMVAVLAYALPLILAYFVLWMVLGVFYLLKGIPSVGGALSVIFSFGPFLLIFGSLLLSVASLLMLFFATPQAALRCKVGWVQAEELWSQFQGNLLSHMLWLGLGMIPLMIVVGLLILAATLTGLTYFEPERTMAIASQWFFIMVPFAAILSPAVVFFFNLSAECCAWMQRKVKST